MAWRNGLTIERRRRRDTYGYCAVRKCGAILYTLKCAVCGVIALRVE